ncbi:MAG TPA: hypothetical protein VLH19_05810 [Patescibacteria group bacterium]|nr:hypothetical protein [Patescibacteria group bacterium]
MAIKIKQQQSQFAAQVQTNTGLQYRLPELDKIPARPPVSAKPKILVKFLTSLIATLILVVFFVLLKNVK